MEIGRIGIWTSVLDSHPMARAQEIAAGIEALGYGALWFPESRGRESFVTSALLLSGTGRIVIATGITNMYGRDPMAMAGAQKTLAEAFPDRFMLGIGVSHKPSVEGLRGHRYDRPLATLRTYLDAMDTALFAAAPPASEPLRLLAALGPKALELARERANGSHPYFVPVEHTKVARNILGPGPILAPEQLVVLETDPTRARAIARTHVPRYLALPNYANNLSRLGYSEADLANGGSDRLVDDVVAWGNLDVVCARVQAHLDAGADHVCIQVWTEAMARHGSGPVVPIPPPMEEWRALADALLR